ncbi:MAG TPA: hypothetical protein VGN12_22700 [Pirellulales bacterium]|jgi:ribosomal protein L31E
MASSLDKVVLEQRVTVFIWMEEQEKVISVAMAPATFRNLKKFTEELHKSALLVQLTDEAIRDIWSNAVEEVLARLHLNTFQFTT